MQDALYIETAPGDGQIMSSDGNVFPKAVVMAFFEFKTKFDRDV